MRDASDGLLDGASRGEQATWLGSPVQDVGREMGGRWKGGLLGAQGKQRTANSESEQCGGSLLHRLHRPATRRRASLDWSQDHTDNMSSMSIMSAIAEKLAWR